MNNPHLGVSTIRVSPPEPNDPFDSGPGEPEAIVRNAIIRNGSTQPSLQRPLQRVAAELNDALSRLEMVRSAAASEEPDLDRLECRIAGLSGTDEARKRRARRIALSIAEDIEEAAHRLQEAFAEEETAE